MSLKKGKIILDFQFKARNKGRLSSFIHLLYCTPMHSLKYVLLLLYVLLIQMQKVFFDHKAMHSTSFHQSPYSKALFFLCVKAKP